jgi:hypothetical protein
MAAHQTNNDLLPQLPKSAAPKGEMTDQPALRCLAQDREISKNEAPAQGYSLDEASNTPSAAIDSGSGNSYRRRYED